MSGPVPSPSMNGTIGWSGTVSRAFFSSIGWPFSGIFGAALAMVTSVRAAQDSERGAPRLARRDEAEDEVEDEGEDRRVVGEREGGVQQGRAADRGAGN